MTAYRIPADPPPAMKQKQRFLVVWESGVWNTNATAYLSGHPGACFLSDNTAVIATYTPAAQLANELAHWVGERRFLLVLPLHGLAGQELLVRNAIANAVPGLEMLQHRAEKQAAIDPETYCHAATPHSFCTTEVAHHHQGGGLGAASGYPRR